MVFYPPKYKKKKEEIRISRTKAQLCFILLFFIISAFIIIIVINPKLKINNKQFYPSDTIQPKDLLRNMDGNIFINNSQDINASIGLGNSMLPTMNNNSIILYITTTFQNIKYGDIIVYTKGDRLIAHRVIEKYNDYLITKGDNNDSRDIKKVYPEQILYKVVGILY